MDFLEVLEHRYDTIVVHLFSVGSYQLGEVLMSLKKERNHQMNDYLMKTWKCLIMDSPVDVQFAPLGLSKAITSNKLIRIVLIYLMKIYLIIFYILTTYHYWNSSNSVKAHPNNCPVLFLFSKTDKTSDPDHNYTLINDFRQRGIHVVDKCWERSPHVTHLAKHPDEYQQVLGEFLRKNT